MPRENFGYGIVIKLNPKFAEHAARLNKIVSEKLPDFENPSNIWHVTLYHLMCPEQDLSELWDKVTKIDFSNITLNFSEIYITHTATHSWFDWLVEKTPDILKIHAQVINDTAGYHKGNIPRCDDIYHTMNPTQTNQVAHYGVSGLFENYKPHTTFFYHSPKESYRSTVHAKALREQAELDFSATVSVIESHVLESSYNMSCTIEEVILGKLGYDGNIVEEIYSHMVHAIGDFEE